MSLKTKILPHLKGAEEGGPRTLRLQFMTFRMKPLMRDMNLNGSPEDKTKDLQNK